MYKKLKGFTIIEILVVVAILSILMALTLPNFTSMNKLTSKNLANTTHKIFINAIDNWVKDNNSPNIRPANFTVKNSQGRTVLDYISNNDVYAITNITKEKKSDGTYVYKFDNKLEDGRKINILFSNGILITSFLNEKNELEKSESLISGVFPLVEPIDVSKPTFKGGDMSSYLLIENKTN